MKAHYGDLVLEIGVVLLERKVVNVFCVKFRRFWSSGLKFMCLHVTPAYP
jgi:hypothetical protein